MDKLRNEQIVIKKDIYDKLGRIYIAKGRIVVLNTSNINKFKRMGVWEQIIANKEGENSKRHRISSRDKVEQISKKYKRLKSEDFSNAMGFAQKIIFEERIFNVYPHLNVLLDHAEAYYTHSINVTILAILLAQSMQYDEQTIREIAIGALLHDIGFIFIDKEIIEKGDLEPTVEEKELIQKHCSLGVMTVKTANIPFKSQKIIEQHHEKLDGTGYPNQLKEHEILEEAKIVGIADVLDTRTSYRDAENIGDIIEEMYNLPEKYSRRYTEVLRSLFEV